MGCNAIASRSTCGTGGCGPVGGGAQSCANGKCSPENLGIANKIQGLMGKDGGAGGCAGGACAGQAGGAQAGGGVNLLEEILKLLRSAGPDGIKQILQQVPELGAMLQQGLGAK